jgi:hypothetical protein
MQGRHVRAIVGAVVLAATATSPAYSHPQGTTGAPAPAREWRPMFDGKSLAGWKESPFVARGKVSVDAGQIILGNGYMTGVSWTMEFPTSNYEIRYQAARIQGNDFFGALTFPVHGAFCTFVNGGWGGMVVGLSSLDLMDASENDTMVLMPFTSGQWYGFRIRVTDDTIAVWIDDVQVISVNVQGREVGLRPGEIEHSRPLGFASYRTVGALRNIEYRILAPGSAAAGVPDWTAEARRAHESRDHHREVEQR